MNLLDEKFVSPLREKRNRTKPRRRKTVKTYILYDTYETGVDLGEEIGCYSSYEEMRKAARQRIEDTDGECSLQYVVLGE